MYVADGVSAVLFTVYIMVLHDYRTHIAFKLYIYFGKISHAYFDIHIFEISFESMYCFNRLSDLIMSDDE